MPLPFSTPLEKPCTSCTYCATLVACSQMTQNSLHDNINLRGLQIIITAVEIHVIGKKWCLHADARNAFVRISLWLGHLFVLPSFSQGRPKEDFSRCKTSYRRRILKFFNMNWMWIWGKEWLRMLNKKSVQYEKKFQKVSQTLLHLFVLKIAYSLPNWNKQNLTDWASFNKRVHRNVHHLTWIDSTTAATCNVVIQNK